MSNDKDNSGAIWRNEKRETDRHPHFTGQAMVDGVEYWVSAWKRDADAKDRAPALRFAFKRKEERGDQRRQERQTARDDFDADTPF